MISNRTFNIFLATTNIPYTITQIDRPSMANAKDATINKANYVADFYDFTITPGPKGNFDLIDFDNAIVRVDTNNYTSGIYATWGYDNFYGVNHLCVRDLTDTSTSDRFYFITEIKPVGASVIEYTCKLDYWLTYWDKVQPTTNQIFVQRGSVDRWTNISSNEKLPILTIPVGKKLVLHQTTFIGVNDGKQVPTLFKIPMCDPRVNLAMQNIVDPNLLTYLANDYILSYIDEDNNEGIITKKEYFDTINNSKFPTLWEWVIDNTNGTKPLIIKELSFGGGTYFKGGSLTITIEGVDYKMTVLQDIYTFKLDKGTVLNPSFTGMSFSDVIDIDYTIIEPDKIPADTLSTTDHTSETIGTFYHYWLDGITYVDIPDTNKLFNIITNQKTAPTSKWIAPGQDGVKETFFNTPLLGLADIPSSGLWNTTFPQIRFYTNKTIISTKLTFDMGKSKPFRNLDPSLNEYQPTHPFINSNGLILRKTLNNVNNYNSCLAYHSKGATSSYDSTRIYPYALCTFISNVANINYETVAGNNQWKVGKMPASVASGLTQPIILIPLQAGVDTPPDKNARGTGVEWLINQGNPCITKIFCCDFPLISETIWSKITKLSTWGFGTDNNQTLGLCDGILLNDVIADRVVRGDGDYQQILDLTTTNIPWYFNNVVSKTDLFDYKKCPMVYLNNHFKMTLNDGAANKEISFDALLEKPTQFLTINCRYNINDTLYNKIGFIENGLYKKSSLTGEAGYISSATYDLPNTSNAYTTFFQNHTNSFNTSKFALKAGLAQNLAKGAAGAVASIGGGLVAGGGLGAVIGGLNAAGNIVGDVINYEIGNMKLNSQVADIKNEPVQIKDISAGDNFSMVMYQKNLKSTLNVISSTPVPYLNITSCSPQQQEIIARQYETNGYIYNTYQDISGNKLWSTRYWFNTWKIDNYNDAINKDGIPNQVVMWFKTIFKNGVRLWNNDGGNSAMFNYTNENWETRLLN